MKRAKLGDLYCMKVPNGYKLYQWAYRIPQIGDYIRVFPHLYDEIPDELERIIESEHSYITGFAAGKAYRKKLSKLLGNFPVPEKFHFPEYKLASNFSGEKIRIEDSMTSMPLCEYCNNINELPNRYRDVTMISGFLPPAWLMYLFDTDFDLTDWSKYWPRAAIDKYIELYEKMLKEEEQE